MVDKITRHKTGRFILVGLSATTIDVALLMLLDALTPLPVVTANVIATSVAFCYSFVANKKYTFRTKGTSLIREMLLFAGFTLFGLWVLQSFVIHYALTVTVDYTESREMALLMAKLLATLTSMSWNYLTYSHFVFVHKKEEEIEAVEKD